MGKTSHAFTLVELLVGVAILAVLSGIVFAAMGPAKARAKSSRNAVKMKQFSAGTFLYAQDFDDHAPNALDTSGLKNFKLDGVLPVPPRYALRISDKSYSELLLPYTKSSDAFRYEPYLGDDPVPSASDQPAWSNLNVDSYPGLARRALSELDEPSKFTHAFHFMASLARDRKGPDNCLVYDGSVRRIPNGDCEEMIFYWERYEP